MKFITLNSTHNRGQEFSGKQQLEKTTVTSLCYIEGLNVQHIISNTIKYVVISGQIPTIPLITIVMNMLTLAVIY